MGKKNRNRSFQEEQSNEQVQQDVVETPVQEVEAEQAQPEVEAQPEVVDASPKVVFPSEQVQKQEPVKQEEKPSKIEITDDAEVNAVSKVLNDAKLDARAKFEAICNSDTQYSALAKNLKSYQDKMGSSVALPKGTVGAANNYNLYMALINIANTPIYTEFKLKFDIANLCFLAYADDAFSEFKLFRYSIDWKFGKDKYVTYRSLAMLIAMLCNKATRQDALKKIVLSKVLKLEGTKFTETAIQNIKRYYES